MFALSLPLVIALHATSPAPPAPPEGAQTTGAVRSVPAAPPSATAPHATTDAAPFEVPQHEAHVALHPASGTIDVDDNITLPPSCTRPRIAVARALHASLDPPSSRGGNATGDVVEVFEVQPATQAVRVRASGPLAGVKPTSVTLDPDDAWLPVLSCDDKTALVAGRVTFTQLPDGWSAISDGNAVGSNGAVDATTWHARAPVQGFHVSAAAFVKEHRRIEGVDVGVWLRARDDALAAAYLDAIASPLAHMQALLGPAPTTSFVLVEDEAPVGVSMAGYTRIGSAVIRLPFIARTSWPHELVHLWWGNGVFVGDDGNWVEGLTTYLADHFAAEETGTAAAFRRNLLQRYADFVAVDPTRDQPVSTFQARTTPASEAIGYGRTAMFFHMLRMHLGDARFIEGLRALWRDARGRRTSIDDVRAAFERASREDLRAWFLDAFTTTGAPSLALREVQVIRTHDGRRSAHVVVGQTQAGPLHRADIPIVVTTVDGRALSTRAELRGREASTTLPVPDDVARVDVDPFFEVFRLVDPAEVPATVSRALGAPRKLFVLPTLASDDERVAWRAFARALCGADDVCIEHDDRAQGTLPDDAAIFVLGYGNDLRGAAYVAARAHGARFDDSGFFAPGVWEQVLAATDRRAAYEAARVDPGKTALIVADRNPRDAQHGLVFVGAPRAALIAALARKLPHLGASSWIALDGVDATRRADGVWSADDDRPLTMRLVDDAPTLPTTGLPPLRAQP